MKRLPFPIVVMLASAFIGWVSGYDFDARGGGVALWVFFTLVFALIAYAEDKEKP